MACPVCNAQNGAVSVRCLECGTILIEEAVSRSAEAQRGMNQLDRRLCTGYGALVGFVVGMGSWFILSQDESAAQGWIGLCSAAGAALGRLIAWRRRNIP